MKKFLSAFLALALCLGFAACSPRENQPLEDSSHDGEERINAEQFLPECFLDPVTEWDSYDQLIAEIRSCTDKEKRAQKMYEAENILMANYCVVPLYYYNDVYLQKESVTGIYATLSQVKYFMYAQPADGRDTLRLCLGPEIETLDPALNTSIDGGSLAVNSFSGLFTYNKNGTIVPACAESCEASKDGLTYTVTLKEDLRWSDGSKLTAADFEYSWKRAAAEETGAGYGFLFSGFDGFGEELNVTAVDEKTLVFVLSEPCAYIEDLLAFPTFYPVKQSEVEKWKDGESGPDHWCSESGFVSNGAFVCTKWEHGKSMTYEKNPYWYDAPNVSLQKIEILLENPDVSYEAYEAGDIDFLDLVPSSRIPDLKDSGEFHVIDALGTYYSCFNCKSPVFDGKSPKQAACMRKALSILIDRVSLCENSGQPGQKPANAFIPYGMADGNGGIFKMDLSLQGYFDPFGMNTDPEGTLAEATDLLKAAGYEFGEDGKLSSETPISLTYLTSSSPYHLSAADSIKKNFAVLGIELTVQTMDTAEYFEEKGKSQYDMCRGGWVADYNDPVGMLEIWMSGSDNNDCRFGKD